MFHGVNSPAGAAFAWAGAVLLLTFVPSAGRGQADPDAKHITFTTTIEPSDPFSDLNQTPPPSDKKLAFQRGDTFLLTITGTLEPGWHTYPLTQRAAEQAAVGLSKLTIDGGANFQPIYPVHESPPEWKDERKELKELSSIYLEHATPFTWTQEVYVKPSAPAGQTIELPIKIRVQVCNKTCLFRNIELKTPVAIAAGPPLTPSEELTKRLGRTQPPPVVVPLPKEYETTLFAPKAASTDHPVPSDSKSKPKGDGGLSLSVLNAILGGLVSLLTPCVFPMIPITVSYFLKQSERRAPVLALAGGKPNGVAEPVPQPVHHSALLLAAVYSGTIVLVLAAGGLVLMRVLQDVSSHFITNFALGGVFLFFALSLLGMYDISLPTWLQDKTAAGESKGGLIGVFFMALTFSIISFACVGPIYGGFITLEASSQSGTGNLWKAVPPVLGFSVAFASPFFLLALFPSLLRSMPRAGSWMNSVKVVLGFLELAAVVKFLRAGELTLTRTSSILTFDLCLGVYIALALACGLYLLGLYRLPHDHDAPESIGVPRLMFSLTFIALSLYMLPGLFKTADGDAQRPNGQVYSWIESFLLPESEGTQASSGSRSSSGRTEKLRWQSKLPEALTEAKRDNKLVFIDFTGLVCTNCSKNEHDVFSRPEVQEALAQHVLVKLYCEGGVRQGVDQQPDSPGAIEMRDKVFHTGSLPLYALVKPQGDRFEVVRMDDQGLIRDVAAFIRFLAKQ